MTPICAIDPGHKQSAYVRLDPASVGRLPFVVVGKAILPNEDLRSAIREGRFGDAMLAVEGIQSFGMPVGKEVFETVFWAGRFVEAWGEPWRIVYRSEVKMHFCQSMRAKDPNIRQALLDRFGPPGKKAAPNPVTYGIANDLWSALAIAVLVADGMGAGVEAAAV